MFSLIKDILMGLFFLGLINIGTDLFSLKKLASKAAQAHQEQNLSYRGWSNMLFNKK